MSDKKLVKDYVVGGFLLCLIFIPEFVKMFISIIYIILFYNIIKIDLSILDKQQAIVATLIFLISPIGAYYFYKNSFVSKITEQFIKILSEETSFFKIKEDA